MPLAGLRRIDMPARTAWAPRFGGQRHHYETWDLAVRLAEGDLWLSHNVVSDSQGRALSNVTAILKAGAESGPMVLRMSAADPHLGLAPAYDAGFDSAGRRGIFSADTARNPVGGRAELDELGANLAPDSGDAILGETFAAGAVTSKEVKLEWDLRWQIGHDSEVFIPAGPGPLRQVAYQIAGCSPSPLIGGRIAINGEGLDLDDSHGEITHAWGRQAPKKYATATCGHWDFDDLARDLLGEGDAKFGLHWVKGGAWGRLGPPTPKTFGWIRVGGELMAFNALPDALAASSHVAWPRWESRLIGLDVKAGVRIEADFDSITQLECRDPSCRRVWRCFAAGARIEMAFERRAGRIWVPAGSVWSDSCRLDFGGYSPEQRVAVFD